MWATEQLRFSLFLRDPLSISDRDWRALTGEPESQARINVPGGKALNGPFGGGLLVLGSIATRVDVTVSVRPEQLAAPDAEPKLPVIGPWDAVRETFVAAFRKWLVGIEVPVLRVAFGGVLLWQTEDNRQTYDRMRELLASVTVEPNAMQDLIYRVNWPRQSIAAPDIKLNRITTWNAMRYGINLLQASSSQLVATPTSEVFAVRLEFDNNTDASRTEPIASDLIQPILEELVQMALENATQGEKP